MTDDHPARIVAPDHWAWRSVLSERETLLEIDRWIAEGDSNPLDPNVCRTGIAALSEENARLRSVLGHCPRGIAVLDEQGQLVGYNREFRALLQREPELGEPLNKHFADGDAELLATVIRSAGTERRAGALVHLEGAGESAMSREIEFLAATLPWVDEASIGVVLASEDRTALLREQAEHARELREVHEANAVGAFGVAEARLAHDLATAATGALEALRDLSASDRAGELIDAARDSLRKCLDSLEKAVATSLASIVPRDANVSADVRECAQRAARLARPSFGRHRLYVSVRVPEGLSVAMSTQELTQVLTNVIANAVQATENAERPGSVDVWAEPVSHGLDFVAIHVKDDGVGIEPSRIAGSFDAWPAVGEPGVGLVVTRRIVERAHGTIKVASEVDHGTEVVIEIPTPSS